MLNKIMNKKKDEGFTIIEVLIVLAIAGLILVVVLIAIPQLQRNQRNTARQNDASRIASSVSNWVANNNGDIPGSADLPTIMLDVGDVSQYDTTDVSLKAVTSPGGDKESDIDKIQIITGSKCGDVSETIDGVTIVARGATPGTSRQFSIIYATENSSGAGTPACVDV